VRTLAKAIIVIILIDQVIQSICKM